MSLFSQKAQKGIAMLIANQAIPASFYRYIGKMSAKKNLLMMGIVTAATCLPLAVFVHPYGALFALSMILSAVPYILIASVFDPFVAWIRGETEKPGAMTGWNVIIHLWPVVSVTWTATIILMISMIFMGKGSDSPLVSNGAQSIAYLVFVGLVAIHQLFVIQRFPSVRKSQKYITLVVFVFLFLYEPISKLWF